MSNVTWMEVLTMLVYYNGVGLTVYSLEDAITAPLWNPRLVTVTVPLRLAWPWQSESARAS